MSTKDLVVFLTIVVLLLSLALLALAETALTRMSAARAESHLENGKPGANQLFELVSKPARFLNPLLLVVLVLQTAQIAATTLLAQRFFGIVGVIVALILNVVVVFVFAEAAPKTWAVKNVDSAALRSAGPVAALTNFWPLRMVARALIAVTNVLSPGRGLQEGPFVSEEELLAMATQAVEADVLEAGEQVYISKVIEFGDTIVREVMVPRPDIVAVENSFRVVDAMEVILTNGLSRVPVYAKNLDEITGLLYAKDLMRAERNGCGQQPSPEHARTARFVPETKRVAELLREMQDEKFHLAMVVDEYGSTAGLVTLEDLIEELVGEIVDEFDVDDPLMEPLPGGALRVDGRLSVDDANEMLDVALPEGDWTSVGGLVFSTLGRVPVGGEVVTVPGYDLCVDKLQGRRITRVRIIPHVTEDSEAEETGLV